MLSSPVNNHRHALEDVTNSSPAQAGTLTKAKTNRKSVHTPQTTVATRLYRGTGTITVQTPKSTHWLLAPTPRKSVTKPEEHQTSADPEEMPQWLTEAATILAGCTTTGLRPEAEANCVGDDATSRVALSWLGAGICDSASTRASLCLAEVRSATAERALQGAEARSLRAEVSALQARQAELEVQGEADAVRREADAVQRERLQADEARAKAEAALVLATSQLQQAQQQAEEAEQQQRAQQQAQQQLGTRLVASEAARDGAQCELEERRIELEARRVELRQAGEEVAKLGALRRGAERERDTALDILGSEQSKRAGLEEAKAGLETALLSKAKALLSATAQLAALRDARPPPQQAGGGGLGGEAAVGSGAAAPRYEPRRNEVRRVTLHKPEAASRLGIRLAGDERPRVVSLHPGLVAAKAGGVAVNDVILTVNGQKAHGHAATTQLLTTACGAIKLELFTPRLSSEGAGGGEVAEADSGQQAAPNPTLSSLTRRHQRPTHVSAPAVLPAAAPRAAPTELRHGPRPRPRSSQYVAVAENGKFRWELRRA